MIKKKLIKILHLEDEPTDAEQLERLLRTADIQCEIKVVHAKADYIKALKEFEPEIILSDHGLPSFSSLEALSILKQSGQRIPFILVTGTMSEEFAVKTMREGASDYLLKDRPQRLPSSILSALEKFRLEKEQSNAELKIRETEKQYADLIQHLPANIAILDKAGTIIDVNSSWKLFADENEFIGNNYGVGTSYIDVAEKATGISEEDQLPLVVALQEMIDGIRESYSMIYPCHSPNKNRWFKLIASRNGNAGNYGFVIMHINITEQQEALQMIEESEAKYRAFFENSMDGILLTVTDGKILAANPAACTMFRMTEEEICNAGRFGLIDPDDSRGRLLIEERQRTGHANGELIFMRNNGSRFPGEISASLFTDAQGANRTLMIISDRTERKKAEEKLILASVELKQLNNRLTLATHSAGMGVWDWNLQNGNLNWDEGMYQLYQIDNKQFGSIYEGWLSRLHPEDKLRVNDELQAAIAGKKEYDTEFRIVWGDASIHYLRATGVVEKDAEGNAKHVIGMNWDITKAKIDDEKIKKSELLLRNIDANSADMICSISEGGLFLHVSAASERILGYTPAELLGKPIFDFVYPEDRKKTEEAAASLMKGNPVNNFENRYVRKDGSTVTLLWAIRWDAKDHIRYGVARDATEIKKAEKAIVSMRKRLADLIAHAPVSMCILIGENHVFEFANSAYLQLFGKSDIIGKTVKEVFPELKGQGFNELLDTVYRTGHLFKANELQIQIDVTGTGILQEIYLNFLYQPYFGSEGNVEGIYYFGENVTEQVTSRRKIEEAEKNYRQIVETAQEGIWVIDKDEKTIFVNNKLCELLEYTREEMVSKEINFFMDEEGKRLSVKGMQMRKKGLPGRAQQKYISKTGRELWADISANPLFDEQGNYKGALAMITDITEQKKIEEENEKLGFVASLTVNAVVVTNADGKITWVNKGFERITEYSFDEAVNKKPGDFLQGPLTALATIDYMRDCRKQGRGFRVEAINYSKSGRHYWLDIEVVPLKDSHDQLTGFMAIEQDITDRKNSEHETLALITKLQKKNKDLQQFSYIVSHNLRAPIAKILGLTSVIQGESEENKFLIEKITEETTNLDEVIRDINIIVSASKTDKEKMQYVLFKTRVDQVLQVLEMEILESKATIICDFAEVKGIVTINGFLYSIIYNLISNAIKYRSANEPSEIRLKTTEDEKFICLSVKDNGLGIDLVKNESKIFGLYKRFHGDSIPGKGVGLHLVKVNAESLGGNVVVESKVNEGTEFKIYLPKNYASIESK
jgi:PAS domain S-box-containing protein